MHPSFLLVVLTLLVGSSLAINRGYLSTPAELAAIKTKAAAGIVPYAKSVSNLVTAASTPSSWVSQTTLGSVTSCADAQSPSFLMGGAPLIIAKALMYRISGNQSDWAFEVKISVSNEI